LVARGTVKRFSEQKGYGYIEPDDEGEEVFFHYTDVEGRGFRSLEEGDRVSYEPVSSASSARRAKTREEAKEVRRVR
jgi:CspA family cold shock protein